jgi:hypothetical protein
VEDVPLSSTALSRSFSSQPGFESTSGLGGGGLKPGVDTSGSAESVLLVSLALGLGAKRWCLAITSLDLRSALGGGLWSGAVEPAFGALVVAFPSCAALRCNAPAYRECKLCGGARGRDGGGARALAGDLFRSTTTGPLSGDARCGQRVPRCGLELGLEYGLRCCPRGSGERWRRSGERLSLRLPLLDLERERERDLPLLDCSRYRGCCAAINLSGGLVFGGCALADLPATFGAGALTMT